MNKEIKEILKYIDQFVYVDQTYNDMKLSKVDGKLILDYITNLQEELEEKEYEIKDLKKQLEAKKEECNSLIEEINPYERYGISENDFH